jgi:hypothetical protein
MNTNTLTIQSGSGRPNTERDYMEESIKSVPFLQDITDSLYNRVVIVAHEKLGNKKQWYFLSNRKPSSTIRKFLLSQKLHILSMRKPFDDDRRFDFLPQVSPADENEHEAVGHSIGGVCVVAAGVHSGETGIVTLVAAKIRVLLDGSGKEINLSQSSVKMIIQ